jgi:protein SCO1
MSHLKLVWVVWCLAALVAQPALAKEQKANEAQGSLFELTSVWKDQNGQTFTWKDMQGKVVLLSMVYTSCQQTCPLIISEMKALQKALPESMTGKVEVLLFSMDPKRDTPEHLAAYAKERKLNPKWRLLHGAEGDVQELAAVLGFRYKKLENGDFAHSNIFTVLDQKGQIRHQQLELFNGRPETVGVVQTLLKPAAPVSIPAAGAK